MSMNVYVELRDLQAAMSHIELSISSSSTELEGEHLMEINVVVKQKHTAQEWECVGDLELGLIDPVVCFGRSSRDLIIRICLHVGIPFRFH